MWLLERQPLTPGRILDTSLKATNIVGPTLAGVGLATIGADMKIVVAMVGAVPPAGTGGTAAVVATVVTLVAVMVALTWVVLPAWVVLLT